MLYGLGVATGIVLWLGYALYLIFRGRRLSPSYPGVVLPAQGPFRTAGQSAASAPFDEEKVQLKCHNEILESDLRAAQEEREKYKHALEAIATLNQDNTAQKIACQALGRKP